jgi:hypothetical protein
MDIVKRLREYGDCPQDVSDGEWAEYSHKAADEIERLREALKYIAYPECVPDEAAKMWEMVKHARAALKGDE